MVYVIATSSFTDILEGSFVQASRATSRSSLAHQKGPGHQPTKDNYKMVFLLPARGLFTSCHNSSSLDGTGESNMKLNCKVPS